VDKKQKVLFDSWTKEQIYHAYLSEYKLKQERGKEISRLKREIAFLRFEENNKDRIISSIKNYLKRMTKPPETT
jgi:hypothetical protein